MPSTMSSLRRRPGRRLRRVAALASVVALSLGVCASGPPEPGLRTAAGAGGGVGYGYAGCGGIQYRTEQTHAIAGAGYETELKTRLFLTGDVTTSISRVRNVTIVEEATEPENVKWDPVHELEGFRRWSANARIGRHWEWMGFEIGAGMFVSDDPMWEPVGVDGPDDASGTTRDGGAIPSGAIWFGAKRGPFVFFDGGTPALVDGGMPEVQFDTRGGLGWRDDWGRAELSVGNGGFSARGMGRLNESLSLGATFVAPGSGPFCPGCYYRDMSWYSGALVLGWQPPRDR